MNKIQKIIFTLIYTLFVTAAGFAGTKTWVGGDSDKPTDWDTAANWSPSGVPTSSDEVVINSGGNQPVIENKTVYMYQTTKSINIKKLTIEDGAELTIVSKKHNVKLSCTYGIINDGTLILDLRNYSKKIAFTKTEFKDQAEIYIKAPFIPPNTYTVKFASNTQIDFKEGSLLTAENGNNNDSLEIDTPTLNFKGGFSSKRNLKIKNSYGGNLNIDIKGSLEARAGVSIPDNTNTNITSSGTVNLMKPLTLTNANWNAGGGTIETYGDFTVPKFEQTGGTLRLKGSLAQYLNIKQAYKLEIGLFCSLSLTENIKISNSLTNNGTFFDADNKTVTLNPPANGTVTITGTSTATNTKFYNLKFTSGGGKTLTINNKIFVNNSLKLEGDNDDKLLTIAGVSNSSAIKLQNNMSGGKWLNVKTNIPIESASYTTTESKPDGPKEDLKDGKPLNWIFNTPLVLMWTGFTNKDWNTALNWAPRTAPTSSTNVIIPRDCYNTPELGSEPPSSIYHAKHVTVEKNASLYLKKNIITERSLDNLGTVYMEGSADQKTWLTSTFRPMFEHKDGSTIVYQNVTAPNAEIWQGPYKKLEFASGVPDTIKAASLEVKEQLTVNKSITLDTGSGNQTYDDTINAGGYDITLEGSTINTKGDISANKIKVTGDWNSNSGKITAGTNIEAAKWTSERGTITAGADITVTGNWNSKRSNISGRNITSSGSKWISWGGIEASGNIDIENELAFTGGSITVGGNLAAKKLNAYSNAYSGGLIVFNGNGTQKLSGKGGNNIEGASIQNLQINSGKTLELESDITITVGLNNQGVFDAVTNSKKVRLVHAAGLPTPPDPPDNITIKNTSAANTKFHDLECTNAGGKALTINGKITVAGNLDISGTPPNNLLNIAGEGEITLGGDQTAAPPPAPAPKIGYYLNIHTNIPISYGHTYTVRESKAEQVSGFSISAGNPKNWIFLNCIDKLTWNGSESTDWGNDGPTNSYKNWTPWGIPGEQTIVTIPSGKPKYPKLENATNAKAKKVTVEVNGELDLAYYVINDTSNTAPLTNNGLLKMTGTADQKTWLERTNNNDKITHGVNSTIEYYKPSSPSSTADIWKGPYKNLKVSENYTGFSADGLTVDQEFDVNVNGADFSITTTGKIQSYNSIKAENKNLNLTASSLKTIGNITANTITATSAGTWTAQNGDIALKGNLTAAQFNQTSGSLIFNGGNLTVQTLTLTNSASKVFSLEVSLSSILHLTTPLTLISNFVNRGKFDVSGKDVTLKPDSTISIKGTTNEADTIFKNLFCEDAGGKTFSVTDKISVNGDLNLSGSYVSTLVNPLTVTGLNGAVYLAFSQKEKGKYLKVYPENIKINRGNINEKYYVAEESTDDNGTTKNKNGWVFYKSFTLVNSFARPNDNKIYLLFEKGSKDGKYIELEENDLAYPGATPLQIFDGASHVYTENRSIAPRKLSLSTIPENHTFWEFTLDDKLSGDWILDKNALVSLDYYGKPKEKHIISDIGIDMVRPQMAFNSVILRSFEADEDDNSLPRLDVRIPTERAASSSNVILHFFSKDSAEHKFWYQGSTPIGIAPNYFAVPQSGTHPYSFTLENNLMTFIIPETDSYLQPETVGCFMYLYDGWLPCARLRNSNDILSFDVWHFKIVGIKKQKGGASIFNNVVNPHKGEEASIAAHLKKAGMLTIQIMTLDGNIVRTLERSYKAAGDHIYSWDGRNNGGNPVASGMYFVRIAGPDIDEMRKILVIK